MSDAAFRSKGSSASMAEVPAMAEHFVPRASSLFGGNRMSGVESEREAAASQMQRSMRAWRKSKDEDVAQTAFVPPSGGGRPLPGDVRKKMEPKLGADLSSVRMHEGGEAADNATKLGARAFTVGSEVHFNAGEFKPGTKEGDRLIAHELTHVVQGQKSGVQRKPEEGEEKGDKGDAAGDKAEKGGAEVSKPEEPAEKEADAKGDAVADELHEGKDDEKDEKGGDKKDKKDEKGKDKKKDKDKDGKHAKDAANDEDEEKKKGEGAEAEGGEKKDDVKEAAPPAAAKLFRKIYLAKQVKVAPADEARLKELEAKLTAAGSKASANLNTISTAVSAGLPILAGLVAFLATGEAHAAIEMFGLGSMATAAMSWLGWGKAKEKVVEEKKDSVNNLEALKGHPEMIQDLVDAVRSGKVPTDKLAEELAKMVEAMPRVDRQRVKAKEKKDAKKDGKAKAQGKDTKSTEEKAEGAAGGLEKAEVTVEILEKLLHFGEALAPIGPALKGASVVMEVIATDASIEEAEKDAKEAAKIEKANKDKGI